MAGNPFNPRTLLIGCLVLIGLFTFIGVGTMAGLFFMVKSSIEGMTEEAPRPMPAMSLDDADLDALRARFDAFLNGDGPPTIALDSEEVNGLIHLMGEEGPGEWLRAEIEGDQLFAQISLPLARLGADAFGLGARYLNGRVGLDVRLEEGRLSAFIRKIELGDRPVPEDILDGISQQNLAGEFTRSLDARDAVLRRIERLEIRDGRVVLHRIQGGDPIA